MKDVSQSSGNRIFSVYGGNPVGGRSITKVNSLNSEKYNQTLSFSNNNRGLINNYESIDEKNIINYNISSINNSSTPIEVKSSGNLLNDTNSISPYLILPEDRITLTFHYPIPANGYANSPGSTDETFNKMTIGKNLKIHMYGSQVKEGSEYHETMNQALTTAEISEPIGVEAVVDKFNIFPRDEYLGSYTSKLPILATSVGRTRFGMSNTSTVDRTVYNLKDVNESLRLAPFSLEGRNFDRHFFKKNRRHRRRLAPEQRLGLKVGSSVHHFVTYQAASASFAAEGVPHVLVGSILAATTQPEMGAISSGSFDSNTYHEYRKSFIFPFTEHYNNDRRYTDGGLGRVFSSFVGSSNHQEASGSAGKNGQILSREKYVFSHDHYGYFSDMLSSAKDSKYTFLDEDGRDVRTFNSVINRIKKGELISSPVKVDFVTASLGSDNVLTYYAESNTSNFESGNKDRDAGIEPYLPFNDPDPIV
jgi:hypothetical protein